MPRDADGGCEVPEERLPPGYSDTVAGSLDGPPATPRPAATVVLLRQGPEGPETLLLRRSRAMGFVPGAYVFPGGRVDAADGGDALDGRWLELTPESAGERLRLDADADPPAIAYYAAAVREALEETGLAPGLVVADGGAPTAAAVAAARAALLDGGASLAQALASLGARIDGSALEYIAHWVTPTVEPRRYDTRFFAAKVDARARATRDERETTELSWLAPAAALDRHAQGRLPMIFPTIRTLEDLSAFETADAALAHYRGREIERVQPRISRTPTGVALKV